MYYAACMFVNKERFKNLPVKFVCVSHIRADTLLQASHWHHGQPVSLDTHSCVRSRSQALSSSLQSE